jgi:hypothetical protein
MFRKTLLATTAVVLGASVAFAATHGTPARHQPTLHFPGVIGHSINGHPVALLRGNTTHQGIVHNNPTHLVPGGVYNNYSKDSNAEFVSWYGFVAEDSAYSYYFSSHSYVKESVAGGNAVQMPGGGKAKGMQFAGFAYSANDEFVGEILSNNGGLPGAVLATTATTTFSDNSLCCTSTRSVSFPKKTSIPAGSFAAVACANSPCYGGWAMEDTDFSGATVDYFHVVEKETYDTYYSGGTQHYTYSSPWHESTYYPTAGAVIVK